jgi:hypothetical protein
MESVTVSKMKLSKIAAIAAGVLLLIIATNFVTHSATTKPVRPAGPGKGFAVLELFTSEGCSSCPAADALLARVQAEAGDRPVYVLAYHVDYWNRLGWKDIFSDPQYSNRQYQYSRWLSGEVYTPQVVVNGRSEYVGSDESALRKAINDQLNTAAPASLTLTGQVNANTLDLQYSVTGNTGKSKLLIAVVQKHAVSQVKAGENEGRTLSHAQIVRQLETIDWKTGKQGTARVHLPAEFNTTDWEIIGLVQNTATGEIDATTRVGIKG